MLNYQKDKISRIDKQSPARTANKTAQVLSFPSTPNQVDTREVRVAEAIIEHARTVFLAADHSKFGRPALVRQGHLDQIDALFTDAAPPADMVETLANAGTQIYVAT